MGDQKTVPPNPPTTTTTTRTTPSSPWSVGFAADKKTLEGKDAVSIVPVYYDGSSSVSARIYVIRQLFGEWWVRHNLTENQRQAAKGRLFPPPPPAEFPHVYMLGCFWAKREEKNTPAPHPHARSFIALYCRNTPTHPSNCPISNFLFSVRSVLLLDKNCKENGVLSKRAGKK